MGRILVLFSRESETEEIQRLLGSVAACLSVPAELVDSPSWYARDFPRCGNWDTWAWETVRGVDYGTRQRKFDGYVLCTPVVARANAQIVLLALQDQMPVYTHSNNKLMRVVGLSPSTDDTFTPVLG
jgi:hypothetical protein